MIPELVKQAVQIKIHAKTESALISEAEYCCACATALNKLSASSEKEKELKEAEQIESLREKMTPYFQEKREEFAGDMQMKRLLDLLIHCRVEGQITDEIRKIMDEI